MFRKPNRARAVRFAIPQLLVLLAFTNQAMAQGSLTGNAIPGKNVDIVGPTPPLTGHAGNVLMQQNEVAGATSLWKPNIQYAAFNDYRLVYDPDGGDAVIGFGYSTDYGRSWFSYALPGFSKDDPSFPPGGADPNIVVLPGVQGGGVVLVNHMAFWRDESQPAQLRTAILYEHNRDTGTPATILYNLINNTGNSSQFHDKPSFEGMVHDPAEGRPDIILDIPPFEGPPGSDASHDGYPLAIQAARVHTCYTKFVGNAAGTKVECQYLDGLDSWSQPQKLSESVERNQGTSIALQQFGNIMHVCWTRFEDNNETGAIMCTKSTDGGETHSKAEVAAEFCAPNWGTGPARFRYNSLPIVTASGDDPEDVAIFFSSRNDATQACDIEGNGNNPDVIGMSPVRFEDDFDTFEENRNPDGSRIKDGFVRTSQNFARIMMVRQKPNGRWDNPVQLDPQDHPAQPHSNGEPLRKNFHQIMPACEAAGGTVTCSYFDTRLDRLNNLATPITSGVIEDAILHMSDTNGNGTLDAEDSGSVLPAGLYDLVPPPASLPPADNNYPLRRNMDLFAVQIAKNPATGNHEISNYKVDPATWYADASGMDSNSVRVSRFATRQDPDGPLGQRKQVEFNFGGARLFDKGKAAFMSDYNGVWALSAIKQFQEDGSTAYVPNHRAPNPATDVFPSIAPVFNLGWTSNHLVRGKVFYTGCDTWDETLQMWVAGSCASSNALPEGALLPLVGEDADENPPMVCSMAPTSAGPLTRNQTVMFAPMRPDVHAELVSAIKGPSFDPTDPDSQPSTFVINVSNGTRTDRTVMLSLEPGNSMRFDQRTNPSPLINIDLVVPRGSSNARTVFDYGDLNNPDLASTVILTVSDGPQVLARLTLDRNSLAPLENVRNRSCSPDPDDPTGPPICNEPVDLLAEEFYELILKREIVTTQSLDLENLDFENTADLLDFENLDFENLDFENLDFENTLVFLDFENLDFENLDLENNLYTNLDFENVVLNLDFENLDFENRLLFLDLENLDFENQVMEFLDFENLDFENLDFENVSTFASDIENLDFENLDFENVAPGDTYTEVSWTADSATNTTTGVDVQPVFSQQLADALLDPTNNARVLLTVRKAYMTPTVTTVSNDPENPFCTPQIVAQNQLVFVAVLTPDQITNAIFNGSVEDPPPEQADTPGFFTTPDASLIISYRFINIPANIDPQVSSGLLVSTQAGDSGLCDDETPDTEINPACEFDFEPDQAPPVILLNGPAEITLEAGVDTYVETATAADDFDGDLTGSLNIAGIVDTGTLGTYILTYNVADAAGNNADTVTRTVHVNDTLVPTITLLGDDPQTIEAGSGPYSHPGATVSDIFDPSPLLFINSQLPPYDFSTVNTAFVGTYFVLYNALDSSGNSADELVRTVNVVDTTPPVITLIGDNPFALEAGIPFADPGTNVSDAGDPGVAVTSDESAVNTSVIGSYTVYYNATDAYGNPAAEVTRTVVVQDTIPPVLDIDIPPVFTPPLGDAVLEPGETTFELSWPVGAVDLEAGLSISCNVGGAVIAPSSTDYDPATGTLNAVFSFFFSAGTTEIFCTVTDQGGNSVPSDLFQVLVEDRPIIDPGTLPTQPFTVEANDPSGYVGPTNVLWDPVLATDQVDPNPIEAVCTPANDLMLGVNTISCIATDSAGNMSDAVEFDATIVDTTAPVITTVQPDITVEANAASGYEFPGIPLEGLWPAVQASDIVDGVIDASCTPNSVSNFALNSGEQSSTHTVTCIARDAAGNPPITSMPGDPDFPATAFTTFTVTVEDNTAPVINTSALPDPAPSSAPLEANGSGGYTPSSPLWVDPIQNGANDIVDVTVDVTCLPGPLSTFTLGNTDVTCSSTDARGNTSMLAPAFTVTVGDTTPPDVTINILDPNPAEATGPSGASVSFSASALDTVSGSIPASCSVGGSPVTSPHVFALGDSVLTCVAVDGQGVQGSAMTTVTVVDTTAPDISATPLTIVTMTASADVFEAELTPSITANDMVDGAGVTISCPLPTDPTTFDVSDSTVEPPEYEILCTATDSAGNQASTLLALTIDFAYDVVIDVPNGNKHAGSTLPMDFWWEIPLTDDRVDPTMFDVEVFWFGPYENNNCTGDNLGTGDGSEAFDSGNSNFRPSESQQLIQYSWQTTPDMLGSFQFVVSPPGTEASGECVVLR